MKLQLKKMQVVSSTIKVFRMVLTNTKTVPFDQIQELQTIKDFSSAEPAIPDFSFPPVLKKKLLTLMAEHQFGTDADCSRRFTQMLKDLCQNDDETYGFLRMRLGRVHPHTTQDVF